MAQLDLHTVEKKWQKHWDLEKTNAFIRESNKPLFCIDVPPPTVSGRMHLGHALGYTQADVIARYKKMQGFNLFYPFGFDDNGLATERFVEKELNIRGNTLQRSEFTKLCLEHTKKAEEELMHDFKALGLAADWSLVYRTISEEVREIAQHSFLDIYTKGRAYRKESPHMFCTTCNTAVAQAELEDSEKESYFIDLLFELENKEKITISTTRPEMLAACISIFVHPDDKRYLGLVGKKAKVPIFNNWVAIRKDARVNPEKGTGIVMCCTFGDQTDMEWYKAHNLELKIIINENGTLNEKAGTYKGMKIKEAREKITAELEKLGLTSGKKKIVHAVNVHERCKTDIEFLVTKQWFIKYLDLKQEFLNQAKQINWNPKHMISRLENWISGLQWDWCISRQRFFGVPFPVWYCKKCGAIKLADEKDLPVDPLKDTPKEVCEKCGSKEFEPEKDVLDTWFTSSLTPQINAKWKIDEKLFEKIYPLDLRPQGHDIITLWAFNTIVKSYLHHKSIPWKNMMVNGWALDAKGRKMSKSLGNVVKPREVIEKYSADALRYWACSVVLGEDVPYNEKEFVAAIRLINKIYNSSKFVNLVTENASYEKLTEKKKKYASEDLWILSRLNSVIKSSTENMENYNFSRALAETRDFFWLEFCDMYIEEVKDRIYSGTEEEKQTAQFVLIETFLTVLKLFTPFMPHITEECYQSLNALNKKSRSITIEKYPKTDSSLINEFYEKMGELKMEIISSIRKYKNSKGMALNKELKKVIIYLEDGKLKEYLEPVKGTISKTCKIQSLEIEVGKAKGAIIEINKQIALLIEE